MSDDKERPASTEVISTAASSRRGGKVKWSSATGKLETVQTETTTTDPTADPQTDRHTPDKSETGAPAREGNGLAAGPATAGNVTTPTEVPASNAPGTSSAEAATPQPEEAPASVPPKKRRPSMRARVKGFKNKATEIPVLVFLAFAIAILIKTFLVQAFYIPSTSMLPTLRTGDRVLVEKLSYRFTDPDRGDVVVFEKSVFGAKKNQDLPWYQDAQGFFRELLGLPTGTEEDYIKRIVAISGDVVEYKGSPRKLLINGEKVAQPFIYRGKDTGSPTLTSADCERLKMQKAGTGCRVPAGRVFVMGDNRGNSEDSRILGPIEEEKIVGRAFVIIWPPSDFGGL